MAIKKLIYLALFLMLSMIFLAHTVSAKQVEEVRFSIAILDQSIQDVLLEIEDITGFSIVVNGHLEETAVSGVFNNVTIQEFFSIIAHGKEMRVHTDPKQSLISISMLPADNIKTQSNSSQKLEMFLESEADYIHKAKQSVKQPSAKEQEALYTDPMSGKSLDEVEREIRLSQKQTKVGSPLSEADFFAEQSDYIEQAKKTVKDTSNKSSGGEAADPFTEKNLEDIDRYLHNRKH